jgi:putative FmdB family regulatory protein
VPTYDYVCTVCGHRAEVVHPLHGHGPSACSRCGAAMKKAFAAPAVHFKGSGWARKERAGRSAGKARSSTAPGDAPAAGETGAGSAGDARPAGDGH